MGHMLARKQKLALPKQSISRVHRVNGREDLGKDLKMIRHASMQLERTREAGKASLLVAYSPGGSVGIKKMKLALAYLVVYYVTSFFVLLLN